MGWLESSYAEELGGEPTASVQELTADAAQFQAIEGEIAPAVRALAIKVGVQRSAARSLEEIENDPKVPALANLLANWPQVYGTVVLIEQDAASAYSR